MDTKLATILLLAATPVWAAEPTGSSPPGVRITAAPSLPEPVIPAISESHRRFLTTVARRTITDAMQERADYSVEYVPSGLADLEYEVVVRLRKNGYLVAAGSAGPAPVATAVRDAALVAARSVLRQDPTASDLLANPLIEIEIVGPSQPLPPIDDWTQPGSVDPYVEPGVHGIALSTKAGTHRVCPSEFITSSTVLSDALDSLARRTHESQTRLSDSKLFRFRTLHWYQAASGEPVVSLHRGLRVLPPSVVSPEELKRTIDRLGEYLVYRQLPSGLFSYQYDAAADRYDTDNNLVRQVGAALATCMYAASSDRSAPRTACELAIRNHLQGVRQVPGKEDASYIATADEQNKLGVTALLCLALTEHPDAASFAQLRHRLVKGMLTLQRQSGMFVTAFPPAIEAGAQDYFPGEALLAMARHYQLEPTGDVLDAFDRAIDFYKGYFEDRPSPAFVPWQVQAYAAIATPTKRRDYAEFVFTLTDWLIEKQLTPDNCDWPELWGGFATYQPGRAGIATASYLEGLCDALTLARSRGDEARSRRYESAVRHGARFVMQLQVRPEEAYFVRSPQDAVWGMRTAPALDLLRIDHVQHALVALLKTQQVLFQHEP